jgi:hypothetical protein
MAPLLFLWAPVLMPLRHLNNAGGRLMLPHFCSQRLELTSSQLMVLRPMTGASFDVIRDALSSHYVESYHKLSGVECASIGLVAAHQ